MFLRRVRLIAEALFWGPLALVAGTAIYFARMVGSLIGAFREEWNTHP